jgi:hypothetical protein
MRPGYIYSGFTAYWFYESDSAFRKALGFGQRLQGKDLVKVTGERIEGWHCAACDHLLVTKAKLKPPLREADGS